jgi:hypothetical protein
MIVLPVAATNALAAAGKEFCRSLPKSSLEGRMPPQRLLPPRRLTVALKTV